MCISCIILSNQGQKHGNPGGGIKYEIDSFGSYEVVAYLIMACHDTFCKHRISRGSRSRSLPFGYIAKTLTVDVTLQYDSTKARQSI